MVGLMKRFGAVAAVDRVSFEVGQGEFVSLLGPSGCGKTTTLRCIGGYEAPTEGTIEIAGRVVNDVPVHRRDIGMVFQSYALFPHRTVAENVTFGLECQKLGRAERRARVAEMLGVVGLSDFADRLPRELSGGMRQRVAIARALVTEPDLLLLDEPFGALDLQTRRSLHEFLRRVWLRTGATVLMVTHDVGEAVYLSERVVVMSNRPGRVAEVVDVPFGRVRGPELRRDERFMALEDEVDDLLHQPR